jgi:regulator of RNase E activity RraA
MTTTQADPFELRKQYKYLRVVDVCDAMDGIGYFNVGLMAPEVRPLWLGMKFWGPALTIRCVPANRPMWKLETTEDIVNAHGIWFKEMGHTGVNNLIQPGHVIITATGGAAEVGYWGSANSLSVMAAGAVGIITDGYCRDTYEAALQKTPICARARGRTIIPGRIEVAEVQVKSAAEASRCARATWWAVTTA